MATQTVYNRIGSKRDLLVGLQEVIEEAGEVSGIQRRIAESGDPREVVASVARLASLDALRDDLDVDRATDVAYSILHHAIWTRLIDECGWSADEAERWYADTLTRVLLPSDR